MTAALSPAAVTPVLTRIWGELLGVAQVGPADNFFQLGGHSLTATRMMARVRGALRVDLPASTVFRQPTFGALAELIAAAEPRPAGGVPAGGAAAMSATQRLQWFAERSSRGQSAYTIPIVVRLAGGLDTGALTRAVRDLAVRHRVLRTRFPDRDGEPYPEVQPAAAGLPVGLVRVPAGLHPWLQGLARRPFDLATEVPLRATIGRISSTEHVLSLVVHHIAADGWSRSLILADLAALYAFHRGLAAAPAAPPQYADVAPRPAGHQTRADLDWWSHHLAGAPGRTTFRTGRPRPATLTDTGAAVDLPLAAGAAAQVRAAARAAGTTAYAVLMSALALLLGRHAGERDVVIATSVAGRDSVESERAVGCFINTIPVRVDLGGDRPVAALLRGVADATVTATEHGSVTYDQIVRRLDPPRDPAYRPLCQVMLTMHNEPLPRPAFAGLTATWIEVDNGGAKTDIFIDLQDDGDRLCGSLVYRTQLYDQTYARRLAGRYVAVVAALCRDLDRPIDTLMERLPGGEDGE